MKYLKKSLIPTNYFDFCSFVEILCIVGLFSFTKYMKENNISDYVEHIDRLKIFLDYLEERI